MDTPKHRLSFASLIAGLVLATAVALVSVLLLVVNRESQSTAKTTAEALLEEIAATTVARVDTVLASITTLTDTGALAAAKVSDTASGTDSFDVLRLLRGLLDQNDLLLSVYIGYPDGAFHQLIAPRGNPMVLQAYKAPEQTAYIDRTIAVAADGGKRETWRFLARDLSELARRTEDTVRYDPRTRPWYEAARQEQRSVYSPPYVFSSSRLPGVTCARGLPGEAGVLGVDVTLARLGDFLAAQRVAQNGTLWIVDRENRVVARPGQNWQGVSGQDAGLPEAARSSDPLIRAVASVMAKDGAPAGRRPFFLDVAGKRYMASARFMPAGLDLAVVVAAPLEDFTGFIDHMFVHVAFFAAGLLVLLVPLGLVVSRRLTRPVRELVGEAEKISQLDFSPGPSIKAHTKEIEQLTSACGTMKATIQAKTVGLVQSREKLRLLVQGGLALAAEKDLASLVTLIFDTAKNLSQADGGVLYLLEGGNLSVELLSVGQGSIILGGLSGHPAPRVKVLPGIMGFLSPDSVLRFACQSLVNRENVRTEGNLVLFPTGLPEEPKDYAINSLIAVPIVTRRGEALGVIELFNPAPVDGLEEFIGSLAAQAALTLDNRNLVQSLRDIFDAIIQVIAASIDAKSPYTAGHCTRVPELTAMLAGAVHDTEDGPFRDFRMETPDDWHQLWIAAWLHDCGKVTTPEYVVDKATKLETIYNRIHEVRMRFEVLYRDAEIAYYRRLLDGEADEAALRAELDAALGELERDFAFVANCNVGGERMSESDRERLAGIASRTWLRHFSDRLGISFEERRAKGEASEPVLPVAEALLADKPEHLVERRKTYDEIKDAKGQPIEVPAYEYNRGELYNLGIGRGTLTAEERFKINEHTLSGLEMLCKIPFPESLGRVTEIASAHHETLVGTGYPLKKTKDQLSVEARILAVADIFEALTAADRPYKQAKTAAEALRIMSFMRNDGHIDPDIFDIFLQKGVYRQYGESFLQPEQNDVADPAAYLRKA